MLPKNGGQGWKRVALAVTAGLLLSTAAGGSLAVSPWAGGSQGMDAGNNNVRLSGALSTAQPALGPGDPVHADDLDRAIRHLTAVSDRTPEPRVDATNRMDELTPKTRVALASVVEATARSIQAREAGVQLDTLATEQARDALLAPTADLLATIDRALPQLQTAAKEQARGLEDTADEPDIDLPGLIAIDHSGNTTYEHFYVLKIDLSGEDTHLDSAGGATGGCFIPCPETSITIDVTGNDTYNHTADVDTSTEMAAQGGAIGYGAVGILVDAAGDDSYTVTGELNGDDPVEVSRMTQGSATGLAAGILADLAGHDVYRTAYTDVPDRTDLPNCGVAVCDYRIGAQGTVHQALGIVDPAWAALVDASGDDDYVAELDLFPAQGVIEHLANTFDTVLEPGKASLVDLGGSDGYHGGTFDNLNHDERQQIVELSSGHYLDTDARDPSVQILDPHDGAEVSDVVNTTIRARDLADLNPALQRSVQTVHVAIGSVSTSEDWPTDTDEKNVTLDVGSLSPGVYTLEVTAENGIGGQGEDQTTVRIS